MRWRLPRAGKPFPNSIHAIAATAMPSIAPLRSKLDVDFFTRAKVEYLLELVETLHSPASRAEVIDIGCGVGNSHPLLAGHFVYLIGGGRPLHVSRGPPNTIPWSTLPPMTGCICGFPMPPSTLPRKWRLWNAISLSGAGSVKTTH
jgi:hypothetical protein